MTIKERQIKGVKRFVIVFSIGSQRRLVTIDKIIIQRNRERIQPVDPELYLKTLGERGLSRCGRPGDENYAALADTFFNFVGDLSDLFFVQRFRNAHDVSRLSLPDVAIQIGEIITAQDRRPLFRLVKNLVEFRLIDPLGNLSLFHRP